MTESEKTRESTTEAFIEFAKKVNVIGKPVLATALPTRGVVYATDPEFYSQTQNVASAEVNQSESEADKELGIKTIKYLGIGLIGTGVLIAASEIKSNRKISRRMLLLKTASAIGGFTGMDLVNIADKHLRLKNQEEN